MEFYIVKKNIWFNNKLYEAGDYAKFDPADPEVQKLIEKKLIESTGTLVDASKPVPTEEENKVQEKVQDQVQVQEKVEPEPELKQDPKLNKKGKRK